MSRSYRISVRECVNRVIRAEDCVTTNLEMLEVLPSEQMAGLLGDELERRGFLRQADGLLVRRDDGVTVTVDPAKGKVKVAAATAVDLNLEGQKDGRTFDDAGRHAERIKEGLRQELQRRPATAGVREGDRPANAGDGQIGGAARRPAHGTGRGGEPRDGGGAEAQGGAAGPDQGDHRRPAGRLTHHRVGSVINEPPRRQERQEGDRPPLGPTLCVGPQGGDALRRGMSSRMARPFYPGRRASRRAFPRRAWERGLRGWEVSSWRSWRLGVSFAL